MREALFICICAILLTACESSEEYWFKNYDGYSAATIFVDNTKSSDAPNSYIALPESIKDSVKKQLVTHVGPSFYTKLCYTGGQILEYENGRKEYYLYYSLNEPKIGAKKYTATVAINQEGKLIDLIDLPDIIKNPYKAEIIELRQAYKIALEKATDKGHIFNICVSFDKNTSCIEWTFTFETEKEKKDSYKHIISVNAHNGEILDQHKMLEYKKGMIDSPDDFENLVDSTKY